MHQGFLPVFNEAIDEIKGGIGFSETGSHSALAFAALRNTTRCKPDTASPGLAERGDKMVSLQSPWDTTSGKDLEDERPWLVTRVFPPQRRFECTLVWPKVPPRVNPNELSA